LLQGNSHKDNMISEVGDVLKDEKADFLFIDGDHSYVGVKKDFANFKQFVADDGIVAFHDIIASDLGVKKFWSEIKGNYSSREIIVKKDQGLKERNEDPWSEWGGIGIIYFNH